MLYIINHDIYFRDSDGAVWAGEDEGVDHINLTATTSRLLAYMLNRQGEVLKREDILDHVWVNYGLRASNNSLNKYIADLRKLFIQFGIDSEIIRTVPTVGFMFTHELAVEKTETSSDMFNASPVSVLNDTADAPPDYPYIANKKATLPYICLSLAILVFVVTLVLTFGNSIASLFTKNSAPQQPDGYRLGSIEHCEIFTLKQSSAARSKLKLAIARDLINKSNLHCIPDTKILFQPSDPVVYGKSGKVFISRCAYNKDDNEKFAGCQSYLEKDYHYAD